MIFPNFFHLFITYYTFFITTECQTRILTDVTNRTINVAHKLAEAELQRNKSKVLENIDIRKKLQIEFNEILNTHKKDLRKSITEHKLKRSTHDVDTPNSIVKKLDENSKSLLKALLKIQNESAPVQPIPKKLKSFFITTLRPKKPLSVPKSIKNPLNASHHANHVKLPITVKADSKESALRSFIKAELQRQDLVPSTVKTTEKDALRTRAPPDFRVKDKLLALPNPQPDRPLVANADILDMAPAKGARVNNMRFKGHLCHRHVLLPEGPKYDHEGRAYLSAHVAFVERVQKQYRFEQTHPPHFMLPSCCNCCRKSVLGCE